VPRLNRARFLFSLAIGDGTQQDGREACVPTGSPSPSTAWKGSSMVRAGTTVSVVFSWLFTLPWARADLFAIDLEVRAGKVRQTAHAETATLGAKPKVPAILEANAGERLAVKWTLRNVDSKTTVKDVVIHFYAAKAEKIGQNNLPKLD